MLKSKLDPSSDEYVLDQLGDCEQKLVSLVEELSTRDLETIHKEMEDEEVKITPHTLFTQGTLSPTLTVPPHSGGRDTRECEDSSTQGGVTIRAVW